MNIISLLETLVNEILSAEEKFLKNPKDFYALETSVKSSAENFSAGFLSTVLSGMDASLHKDAWRKLRYTIARHDQRTLITSVGDVVFDSTYFASREKNGGYHHLVEEMMGLDPHDKIHKCSSEAAAG